MARREERHWWYAGMRRVALAVLEHALAGQTGLRILGATFDADGWAPGAFEPPQPLLTTLEQIVWDHDARFTAVKVFGVDAIGALPGKEASAAILKIVRQGSQVPPAVQKPFTAAMIGFQIFAARSTAFVPSSRRYPSTSLSPSF